MRASLPKGCVSDFHSKSAVDDQRPRRVPTERRTQACASNKCLEFPLIVSTHAPLQGVLPSCPCCPMPTRAPLQGVDAKVVQGIASGNTLLNTLALQGVLSDKVDRDLDDCALDDLCGLCNDDCPDMVFDEPDEFTLLQAQKAFARRAAYGTNGAAPGVQTLGSKPAKSGSRPLKADETTSYNKPVGNVITRADSAAKGLSPSSDDATPSEMSVTEPTSKLPNLVGVCWKWHGAAATAALRTATAGNTGSERGRP